ncbi:MAG TPA: hypothetical protein VGM18_10280 [Candidatus Sulfotelmatobacter sp.]
MPGRSCARLLVISLLIVSAAPMRGQADRLGVSQNAEVGTAPSILDLYSLRPPRTGASGAPLQPPPIRPVGFHLIASAAGTIFSGTVTSVARRPFSRGQTVETVAITFHIENAIRGAAPGQDLTVLQWTGLWSAGQRYRVGERVLLFLYPPSKLGLTSCVAGPMGRFTIDPRGRVLLTAQHLSSFKADPILGGKALASFSDFARAVERAGQEE